MAIQPPVLYVDDKPYNLAVSAVGNVGSDHWVEYLVVGETVGLAKRIEGLSKNAPDSILISQSTYDYVSDLIEAERMQPVVLSEASGEIGLYRVMSKRLAGNPRSPRP